MRVVGVAALIAAAVVASGYAVQRIALPQPRKGDVLAVRATAWLARYRLSHADVAAGGRWLRASCRRGWLGTRRGTYLHLSDGTAIADLPPHTLRLDPRGLRRPVALLQAAGCTKVLADRLATDAEFGAPVSTSPVFINGEAAFAIRFPHLTVYVNRHSGLPIGARTPWAHGVFRLLPA